MAGGWSADTRAAQLPFQTLLFLSPPFRDCVGYATLGLSDQVLRSRVTSKLLRLELFMILRERQQDGAAKAMQLLGAELLRSGSAVLRGDTVRLPTSLCAGSSLDVLYASSPVYLPEGFAECDLGDGLKCAIVWLVPISLTEANYVRSHGREAFESELIAQDPDLLDVERREMSLH